MTLAIARNSLNKLLRITHPRVPTEREISGTLSSPSKILMVTPTTLLGGITRTLGGNNLKETHPTHLIVSNQAVYPQTATSTILPMDLKD